MAVCDKRLRNVLLLSFAFMLLFTAFQTMGNAQKTITESIREDNSKFNAESYISSCIIYSVMAICNWGTPSLISVIGPNFTMLIGASTYVLFIMSFLEPHVWLFYLASTIIGMGAAAIWSGQGNYLTLNSTAETISRNSGIFWAIFQLSFFIGNFFVYFAFKGLKKIGGSKRTMVLWTLSGIGIAGFLMFIFVPRRKKNQEEDVLAQEDKEGPLKTFVGALKLSITKRMLLLGVVFIYTGFAQTFITGVYSSCIGFTERWSGAKELVGLSGIFIGVGEILGGASFGILGAKTTKIGRYFIVIGGCCIHELAYGLIFFNLPNNSPFKDTTDKAIISSSSKEVAIFCSFLLGLGDACFNTQIYAILGDVYAKTSASAFAIFKFAQCVSGAVSFFYASQLILYGQLGILIIMAVLGTLTYVIVDLQVRKEKVLTET